MEMKEGQFGKIGEHMVGFELSKRGWIVFFPPYDERIDIVALKFICEKCNAFWDTTHMLTCTNIKCDLYNKVIIKSKILKSKKMNRQIVLIFSIILCSLTSQNSFGNNPQLGDFVRANQLYTAAQYDSAVKLYETILSKGYESAELYYNLGNAYYKAGNIPKAILNYERARLLKPNDEEINFNLQLAQTMVVDKINVLPEFFLKRWWRSFSYWFSSNVWAVISLICFVIMLIGVAVYLFIATSVLKKISFFLSVLLLAMSLVSLSHSLSLKKERTAHNTAIVMSPTVTVRSAPDENSTELFVIHEGTKVWIIDQVGDWLRIKIADGNNGWLKLLEVEKI